MAKETTLDITYLLEPAEGRDRNVVRTMMRQLSNERFEKLTTGRREAISDLETDWYKIAVWFVYLRTGKENPKKSPFSAIEFKACRSFAEFISSQLDLCLAVFEASKDDLPYADPHDFFHHCICEWKQWGYDRLLRDNSVIEICKGEKVKQMRSIAQMFEDEKNPFQDIEGQKHHFELLTRAIKDSRKVVSSNPDSVRLKRAWLNFQESFRSYIKDVHRNNALKGLEIGDDALRIIDVGNSRRRKSRPKPVTLRVKGFQDEIFQI